MAPGCCRVVRNLQGPIDALVVVGGGRMGAAIVGGVTSTRTIDPRRVVVVNPGEDRCAWLRAEFGVAAVETVGEAASYLAEIDGSSPCCLLAVKPQVLPSVIGEVDAAFPGVTVASVAVGISTDYLELNLPSGGAAVRVMPNTPAMVGRGVSLVSSGSRATEGDTAAVVDLFSTVGEVHVIDESLQNVGAALSGSGPAYFALVVRSLEDAAVARGLDRTIARRLATETAAGTAALLSTTGVAPTELMNQVSSPGGTTLAALAALQDADLSGAFDRAVGAAIRRAEELGGR